MRSFKMPNALTKNMAAPITHTEMRFPSLLSLGYARTRYKNSPVTATIIYIGSPATSTNISLDSTYAANKKCPIAITTAAHIKAMLMRRFLNFTKLTMASASGTSATAESR